MGIRKGEGERRDDVRLRLGQVAADVFVTNVVWTFHNFRMKNARSLSKLKSASPYLG